MKKATGVISVLLFV